MLDSFVSLIDTFAKQYWYFWIFFMMVLESSFIPFPSEIAMIPAWFFASQWKMDFSIALFFWTLWALVWATINFFIWYFLWEKLLLKLIKKYWKYFLIKEETYWKSEKFFEKHWWVTTFTARFIPWIRQFVSLPAWVFKMDFKLFLFLTWLWAWFWNLILMIIWYVAWENKELITHYLKDITIWWVVLVFIIVIFYYFINKRKNETRQS